jgi:hypothetical protein
LAAFSRIAVPASKPGVPQQKKLASITAAKFPGEDADWSVVECSLLPSGEVKCAMSCLLRDPEFNSSK